MSSSWSFETFENDLASSQARTGNYDPSRKYPPPRTDDEERARIEFLKADNVRLRASIEHYNMRAAEAIAAAAVKYQETEFSEGRTISTAEAVTHVIKINAKDTRVPYDNRTKYFKPGLKHVR